LGELDPEEAITFSGTIGTALKEAGIPAVSEDRFRACASALIPDARGIECGDCGESISPTWFIGVPRPGEDERDPALNGWNDTDGLLATEIPSCDRKELLEAYIGFS
jgi:hypothetical protein